MRTKVAARETMPRQKRSHQVYIMFSQAMSEGSGARSNSQRSSTRPQQQKKFF